MTKAEILHISFPVMSATATSPKKITAATFKAFIRKNREALQVMVESSFDGMTDGTEFNRNAAFKPAVERAEFDNHTCGVNGVWRVGNSRDWFQAYEKDGFTGISFSNCCGSGVVAIQTGPTPQPIPEAPKAPIVETPEAVASNIVFHQFR